MCIGTRNTQSPRPQRPPESAWRGAVSPARSGCKSQPEMAIRGGSQLAKSDRHGPAPRPRASAPAQDTPGGDSDAARGGIGATGGPSLPVSSHGSAPLAGALLAQGKNRAEGPLKHMP